MVQDTLVSSNGRAKDSVQETPESSNLNKKRGVMLMTRIWTLPAHQKLTCALNGSGQPIGKSGQTFKRRLGTFCLSHAHCPLVPVNWAHVPNNVKENAWVEIEVVTY